MKKALVLLPALMLLAACGTSPHVVSSPVVGINRSLVDSSSSIPSAEGWAESTEVSSHPWDESHGIQPQMDMEAWSAEPAAEGDAWANSCGPNAGYEEQLVCSGVPGGSVPRG